MVEEAPQEASPRRRRQRGRAESQGRAAWLCSCHCSSHIPRASSRSGPAVSPGDGAPLSRGIVWPGSLAATPIASTIPAARVSSSPGAESPKAKRRLRSEDQSLSPRPVQSAEREAWPWLGWVPRGSEAAPRPVSKEGGHWSQSLRIENSPTRQRGLPRPRVPSECQVRPSGPQPSGRRRRQRTGLPAGTRLPARQRGTGHPVRGPSRIVPAPPYLRGPGRGR